MPVTVNHLLPRGMVLNIVMVFAILLYGVAVAAESRQPDTATVSQNWHKLELRDSGVTGSVTTRVELKTLPAAARQSTLLDAPQLMSPRQAGKRIGVLEVANSIRLLLGVDIEKRSRLWFNEDDGLPLQLIRLRQGNKPSQKLYRFGSSQVYRQRRQPADRAETQQPAGDWSEISESYYSLPGPGEECPVILESSQLLYRLSSPDHVFSETGGAFCVFDRQHVYRVGFRNLGRAPLDVDYLQVEASQETRVKRTLQAIQVTLSGRPLDGAPADVPPFSFLGLQGDIQLLFSDPGRIPLRVRGQVPGFGMIDLELGELTRLRLASP